MGNYSKSVKSTKTETKTDWLYRYNPKTFENYRVKAEFIRRPHSYGWEFKRGSDDYATYEVV